MNFNVVRYYNKRRYGKGPMSQCVKNAVYRVVIAGREVINSPDQKAPYNTNMQILQLHMVKRVVIKHGYHCMKLYKITEDAESFHDQWYPKQDASMSCGHFDLPDMSHSQTE